MSGWGFNIGVLRNADETDWDIVDFRTDPADAWERAEELRAEYSAEFTIYILDPLRRSAEGHCRRASEARGAVRP